MKVTDSVKDLQGNKVPTTTKIVKVEDKVAPTYVDYKQTNASTFEFNFSEDLDPTEGSVSLKAADGTTISGVVPTVAGSKITVVLPGTVQAGKEVKVSFTGQKDFAGNVLETPFDVTVKKGALDGVAPEVDSVKPINGKKFEINFSEEVQGFEAADLTVAGTTIKSVTQDKEDKTKYVVELNDVVTGLTKIAVTADSYQDLSGELGKAYSQLVKFEEDTTKPTVEVEASKDEDGKQILTFTTSEDATVKATGTITLPAKAVKNFVTSTGNITFDVSDLTVVPKTSNKYTVALADVKYAGAALETDTEYTVSLAADIFKDVAENANEAKTDAFKFTREADKDNAKPVLTDADVAVVDNNTFTVDFGTSVELDNATVVNPANYSVAGATVESVTLAADGVATVKLAKGSVTSTGDRIVKVKGIKAKNGNVMDDFTTTKTFKENVAPTITKVALTDVEKAKAAVTTATNATVTSSDVGKATISGTTTDNGEAVYTYNGTTWSKTSGDDLTGISLTPVIALNGDTVTVTATGGIPTSSATPGATEVTLTLSEDVTATATTVYTVNVDGKALDGITATVQAQGAAKNVVVVKINKELTDTEFAKGVTLTSADYKIVDTAGNKVDIAKEGIKVEQ